MYNLFYYVGRTFINKEYKSCVWYVNTEDVFVGCVMKNICEEIRRTSVLLYKHVGPKAAVYCLLLGDCAVGGTRTEKLLR